MTNQTNHRYQEPVITKSLLWLDNLRLDSSNSWIRLESSNLDVLLAPNTTSTSTDDDDDDYDAVLLALCHLDILSAFTEGGIPVQTRYEEAAAIALAAHHLNMGDDSLIPQLLGLNQTCPIRFTIQLSDTQANNGIALGHVADATTSRVQPSQSSDGSTSSGARQGRIRPRRQPCAFVGTTYSRVSLAATMLTGRRGVPQVSPSATSAELDDKEQHALFARTIPSDQDTAVAIVQFFRHVLQVQYLAIINIHDTYGSSMVQAMLLAAQQYAPDMVIHPVAIQGDALSIQTAVTSVRETGYTYIWCILYTAETHDQVMEEAHRQGIAGTGRHCWFFSDSFNEVLRNRDFVAGSVLDQAYQGVGLIEAISGIPSGLLLDNGSSSSYDTFLEQLAQLDNPADVAYLESIAPPLQPFDHNNTFADFENFLNARNPVTSVFAYEAAIALGLSACHVISDNSVVENNTNDSFLILRGTDHYEQMIHSTFTGISGTVAFDPDTGSRDSRTALYTVQNFVRSSSPTNPDRVVFTSQISYKMNQGQWHKLDDFIFNDGTSAIPSDIPHASLSDEVVSVGVRATVLIFCGVIFCEALGFIYWTERYKTSRVVLSSQPFFLHTICLGVLVFGSSIIPMSLDHGVVGMEGAQIACNALLWLLTMGFGTTVSAFLAKTHRVNQLLNNPNKFQRIQVTVRQVMTPILITLSRKSITPTMVPLPMC